MKLSDLADTLSEPDENSESFSGNATIKANYFYKKTQITTLSDDSGFILNSSKNFPGVKTARFAKKNGGIDNAVKKIFENISTPQVLITFHCSLALVGNRSNLVSKGSVTGNLVKNPLGKNGFGYDSYFIPLSKKMSYAEMNKEEKFFCSHRYFAFKDLANKIS